MRRVMEHVVANVAENQSGEHARRQAPENQEEKTIEKKRKRNAYAWWHDEPSSIVWIVVMNTVNNVMQSFSQARLWFVMKYVPVDHVLEQRPEQSTEQKQSRDSQDRQILLPKRDVKHVADDRHIKHQRGRRMHARKEFHEIALEHPNGFVLLRDVEALRHN